MSQEYVDGSCFIWPGHMVQMNVIGFNIEPPRIQTDVTFVRESPRAGGGYWVVGSAETMALCQELTDPERARLTTRLLNLPRNANKVLVSIPELTASLLESQLPADFPMSRHWIDTEKLISEAKSVPPLPVHERAERLLGFLADETATIGQKIWLDTRVQPEPKPESQSRRQNTDIIIHAPPEPKPELQSRWRRALAWSESSQNQEARYLADYLKQKGWIKAVPTAHRPHLSLIVTVPGYAQLQQVAARKSEAQGFVAMWFGEEMNDVYSEAIRPAIECAGFEAKRIDEDDQAVKIDDAIMNAIRRSRFLVVDLTHGCDGARGGVYFEAGFALGLDIDVIFCCRKRLEGQVHFDVRQYSIIYYATLDELRQRLEDRIVNRMGEGPKRIEQATTVP